MRIAKVLENGAEIAAIEHKGGLYRVEGLDGLLGAPIPTSIASGAFLFDRRVFGLGLAGLDEHEAALRDGYHLEDVRLEQTIVLPPTSRDPALFDLVDGGPEVAVRVSGRALHGHQGVGVLPTSAGPIHVAPGVAILLGEDLHVPTMEEAMGAIVGYSLVLAWSLDEADEEARAGGLGPSVAREVGTHVGPSLVTLDAAFGNGFGVRVGIADKPVGETIVPVDHDRVTRALKRAARFGDLHAGDALLVLAGKRYAVRHGEWVTIESPLLGELAGRMGGAPGLRHRPGSVSAPLATRSARR